MGKSTLTRALERERVGSGGPAEASATETSGAARPETHIMAGPPVPINAGVAELEYAPGPHPEAGSTAAAEAGYAGSTPASSTNSFPSREQFAAAFPKLRMSLQDGYYDAIRDACAEFEIDTPFRVAAALAQWGHETGGLQYLEELGGTSYFLRYEGRKDLGNTIQGDGVRYHGRGIPMLTGKANYAEFGRLLGVDLLGFPGLAAMGRRRKRLRIRLR